jgi:amidophosphoribosyltransferase
MVADSMREACGVVGVYSKGEDVARVAFFGLYALQHRGQESAGISSADGERIRTRVSMGLVSQAFQEDHLTDLPGHIAIGHTRYSTTGSSHIVNAQPIISQGPEVELALAHNGNVINALELRHELEGLGCHFKGSNDSEIIAQLLSHAPSHNWEGRISYIMRKLRGAYSLTVMTKDAVFGIRDPLGVRPLCIGKLNGGWVIASESCALDHVGATYIREVEPGEAVMIDSEGLKTVYQSRQSTRRASCVFENIYFARPDSIMDGRLLYSDRMKMGAELAKEFPVEADMVIGVPDSATAAAVGYSQESGIPFGEGLVKNRYVGRTFIQPDQRFRELGVRRKLNPLPELIKGKRLVVVDDSIVRGTTTPHVVELLRRGGAKEIHLRICAPPIISTCHFGVDMASKKELIASDKSVEDIRELVAADSLGYLSIEGLVRSVGRPRENFCMGCFTGEYPIPVQLEMDKLVMEAQPTAD